MDFSHLKQIYDADGFVVIRGFLAGDDLGQLKDNLDRYVKDVVPSLPDSEAFYEDRSFPETLKQLNRLQNDAFFAEYLKHPKWMQTAVALLGEPAWVHGAEWFNKPPKTCHATPPHQDNYYFCLTPPHVLTMWLALDPVDEENGCLRYVKQSHRKGLRPHNRTNTLGFSQGIADYSDADIATETPVPAAPGDLLVHHGNTIHRANANRSTTRHRRSFGMVFQGQSCVRDEAAFQRYSESSRAQHREMGLKT